MGAQQSVAEGIIKSKNFTILGYKENDIYGSFKIIESQGNQYAMVSKTCQNEESYINFCRILKETQQLNRINQLVKLVEVDMQEESNLCSTFYKVSALYEYYDTTLREITKQASVNCLFVLKSLSEGLIELYSNNLVHGNLTPDFILIDKSKGEVKLNNCTQLTGYNHYKRILASDGTWYLSPELVAAIEKKNLRPQYNHEKNEVYQLGLIALELWGNVNIQSFYNKQSCVLNKIIINEAIDEFGVKNGQVLKNVIKQMLEEDPNSRPTMAELNAVFAQLYENQLQIIEEEPKVLQNAQPITQQQVVTLCELNQEEEVHQEIVEIHEESFQHQNVNNSNEICKQQFEESPKKVEKSSVHLHPQSLKSSISQSIKEYYVTGSIAAQFGQLTFLENNTEYQSIGAAQFENHHDLDQDVLQEKPQNIQQNSTKSHESTIIKKSVKVNCNPQNKKSILIKRPKRESLETKLPKQAVVITKRR